jgi:ribosome-interacting GTPase 1
MRIYTKEHGKGKTDKPIILDKEKKVKDVAEKIFHGFSENVKETFVTGPSSKFSNQKVSLNHKLKDLDIIEFKTK